MQSKHSQAFQKVDVFFKQFNPLYLKKREMLLYSQDASQSIYYIRNGYVKVYRISEQGEELTLTILKPDDFFPLTFGMHTLSNNYYLEAMTQLEFYKAPKEQFLSFITEHTDVFYALTSNMLIRFDNVLSQIENLVFHNAFTKVAATIHMCAKRFGEKRGNTIIIPIPLTHKDIASLIGITRETTSLEMKKLEKRGFISRLGRFLLINDVKALEQAFLLPQPTTQLTFHL